MMRSINYHFLIIKIHHFLVTSFLLNNDTKFSRRYFLKLRRRNCQSAAPVYKDTLYSRMIFLRSVEVSGIRMSLYVNNRNQNLSFL